MKLVKSVVMVFKNLAYIYSRDVYDFSYEQEAEVWLQADHSMCSWFNICLYETKRIYEGLNKALKIAHLNDISCRGKPSADR